MLTQLQYFLTGLDVDVSKFWIYFLFIYISTLCITALYETPPSISLLNLIGIESLGV